jgi:signal transduction histidine kinase
MEREPVSLFERGRLSMARIAVGSGEGTLQALRRATEISARTLEVARCGIWLFDGPDHIRCVEMFDARTQEHSRDEVLDLTSSPKYLAAIRSRRTVVASDAPRDAQTAELSPHYLAARGITSMLDAPIFRHGEVGGIVCHEHVGPARSWSGRDADFAASVADILTALFEQAERVQAEAALAAQRERIARAERMEALARMGAGVIHDVRNLLTVFASAAAVLRRDPSPEERATLTANMDEAVASATRMLSALQDFCRLQDTKPQLLELAPLIDGQLPLLRALLGDKGTLDAELQPGCVVNIDRSQLDQVLINLVTNARDALVRPGKVLIRLRAEPPHAVLEVSDPGAGMDEVTAARAFDPYFSTKTEGQGLGLATVHGIVLQNGGTIELSTEPGAGARFSIRWPLCA